MHKEFEIKKSETYIEFFCSSRGSPDYSTYYEMSAVKIAVGKSINLR